MNATSSESISQSPIASRPRQPSVAVLMASYNGVEFVETQIRSLARNSTPFTLYWLDDHSTDQTRELVRAIAIEVGVPLKERHRPDHQGLPGAFFSLLDSVESDIYLFCDQDDLWQDGKIDATVANLLSDLESPVLCFSDPLLFKEDEPTSFYRLSEVGGAKTELSLHETRAFMTLTAAGHTQAFTRPLRDIFVRHQAIARRHAIMHDAWMYLIAVASGSVRIMHHVPTTLYRWHGRNTSGAYCSWVGRGAGQLRVSREQQKKVRQVLAKEAKGFLLAADTLRPGKRLNRMLRVAQIVATIDRRQSVLSVLRMALGRMLWPNARMAMNLATDCVFYDARA